MNTKAFTTSKLITAIHAGSLHGVMNALAEGDDIEAPDMHGYAGLPLRTACFTGNLAVVRELLAHGANPNAVANDGPGGPLRLALRKGHMDIVGLLLEVGAVVPEDVTLPPQALDILCDTLPTPPQATAVNLDIPLAFTPVDVTSSTADIDAIDHFGAETRLLSTDILFLDENEPQAAPPPLKNQP